MTAPGVGPVLVVGDVVRDVTVRLSGPIRPDLDTAAEISAQGGGSAANLAAWLACVGADVDFAGRTGAADLAAHAAELTAAGVRPYLASDSHRPGGTVVVLVGPDGGRSMLTDRGANAALSPTDLPAGPLSRMRHLHLSGYVLLTAGGRTAAAAARSAAAARGVPVSVDPGSFLADMGAETFHRYAAGADLLAANRDEAVLLADGGPGDEPDVLASRLSSRYPLVVLTLGSAGAIVAAPGRGPIWLPVEPTAVVDTTGAGDALLAGFLAARLGGADVTAALRAGLRLAARAVARPGARPQARPYS